MDIISKEDAKSQQLSRFYTGIPCKHGHVGERFVRNGYCVKCTNELNVRWKKKTGYDKRFRDSEGRKEKRTAVSRNWRHNNPLQAKRWSSSDKGKQYNAEWDKGAGKIRRLLSNVRTRAKSKGLEFSLCADDLIIPEYCPVLGIKLDYDANKRTYNTPSVDRIDNTKGYTPDNVRIISWRANRLKWDANVDELEAILRYMKNE